MADVRADDMFRDLVERVVEEKLRALGLVRDGVRS